MGSLYLAAFFVACAASFSATPFSIWLAKRWNVLDLPSARKVHKEPIPRWGGLAIYIGVLAGVIGTYAGYPRFRVLLDYRHSVYEHGRLIDIVSIDKQLMGILVGLTVVLILGMMDDRQPVMAPIKLSMQVI